MTILVGTLSIAITLAWGGFLRDMHEVTLSRQLAQTAADAAALAAVAEAAPYGVGAPAAQAREYAEANGAHLLSCDCEAGAVGAQVEVSYRGVVAQARAAYDPRRLQPLPTAATQGLHPALAEAVGALVRASEGAVYVVSGYRPPQRQAELWKQALAKYGSPEVADDWVAPPGRSMHERGLAVDLGGDTGLAARLVADLGLPLYRPLPHEPWHFELVGTRRTP